MTLSALDIYLVTRMDSLGFFFALVTILSAVCIAFFVIRWIDASDYFDGKEEAEKKRAYAAKRIMIFFCPLLVGAFGVVLTPSTKTLAAMYVLPAIVNSEAVQQIPSELTTLAREWLQELRPTKKRGAK